MRELFARYFLHRRCFNIAQLFHELDKLVASTSLYQAQKLAILEKTQTQENSKLLETTQTQEKSLKKLWP